MLVLFGVMILLLIMGFPMMMTMLLATLTYVTMYAPMVQPFITVQQMILGVQAPVLMAIPMFILAADIMSMGQTSERLLDFVESLVGHLNGGLASTTSITCALFGAVSGSTQATVVAVGTPVRKKLLARGYSDSEAMALIINSSNLAYLIPPSLGMIVYGVASGASIGDLFIAGIGPAVVIILLFSAYNVFYAKKNNIPRLPKASTAERLLATKRCLLPFGFPIIIMGGIYSGIFSPTEAAAVSVLYAAIIEMCIYKSVKVKDLYKIALSTGVLTTVVFILVAVGQGFSWVISYDRIPQMLTQGLLGDSASVFLILLTVNIVFFIGCMFVEAIVVILILAPIFAPIAQNAGIDLVHLGILITLQVAIGSGTPPFGTSIFTCCAIFDKPYIEVIRNEGPYIAILLFACLLISAFPEISLFLGGLMK
ncbi:TRAP transporter large permease [Halodesulfovibrio sp. MK-HDV]|uniref:TRAP transporter large permease n=1 Tax=unclassified Halodesulfovibrio TaxID=2644657 RepID=UPI00136C59D5|nr:TRAP transporter large permease [Halodesulfovibrio sp. MK-HDV]KAF1077047.1 Ectoine TRAP transporter large permease protein TeaC [Halodesulfovibrio sp. MK-HDV]